MKTQFIKPENVYLIWELLSEQNIIKNQPNQVKEQISNYVVNGINSFYINISKLNSKLSLIDLNKEYIKFIILHVKSNYPNENNKIKIHDEPITYKDMQEKRELEFNTKFNELQDDFANTVAIKKPDTPQFEDDVGLKSVSVNEMEERIKEMTMRRKYDLQDIENNLNNNNDNNDNNNNNNNNNDNNNNNNNNDNNDKKNVTFENKDKDNEDKNVVNSFHNFFSNLDTYVEVNNENANNENANNENANDKNFNDKNTILQIQINEIKDKINLLESKIDMILEKM